MKYPIILLSLVHLTFICDAQEFTLHSNSPFGIQLMNSNTSDRAASNVFFFDNDFDGDLDLFITGLDFIDPVDNPAWENVHFFIEYQENTGNRWNPQFAERSDIFEEFPYPVGYFAPSAGDLNGDQILDFIVNADIDDIGNQSLLHLIGEPGGNTFEVVRFDSIYRFVTESFYVPKLVDLDLDGDLDLLMSGFDPAFGEEDGANLPNYYYAKNTGTTNAPSFQGWYPNPYGLIPHPFTEVLSSGDIDNDGDIDLIGTTTFITDDSTAYINVHLNNPEPNGRPLFDTNLESPFGLPVTTGEDQFTSPNLADLDGDGDLDFLVLEVSADTTLIRYYENNLCTVMTSEMLVSICEGGNFELGGNIYSEPGQYTVHLLSEDGCDSIILLTILLDPVFTTYLSETICQGESVTIGNEVFTTSGDYIVPLVAANGCDSIVVLSLTVDETYNVNLNETICNGEVYSIGLQDFTEPGHYEVLFFTQAGCDSLIALDLNVIVVDNSITVQENTLTANLADATYQWINCDTGEDIPGATGQSYTVLVTGNYAVHVTDGSDCSATSECVHVVITSTEDVEYATAVTVYPNPAHGFITILNTSQYPVTSLTLTNLVGQVVTESNMQGRQGIDIDYLKPGVYIARIEINGVMVLKKVIVI